MFKLIPALTGEALRREKQRDYRNLVILQVSVIILFFTLEEVLNLCGWTDHREFTQTFFLAAAGLYAYMLWDMLRNFTNSKLIIYGVLVSLFVLYVLGIISENPFYDFTDNKRPYYFIIHFVLAGIETLVIVLAIRDIFKKQEQYANKLWGSALIYITMGTSFGSLYDLINIVEPGSFGADVPLGFASYQEGIYYSLNTLGGLDTAYPNASKLMRNIAVIESIWGNLYLVFLIGQILGGPAIFQRNKERDDAHLKKDMEDGMLKDADKEEDSLDKASVSAYRS